MPAAVAAEPRASLLDFEQPVIQEHDLDRKAVGAADDQPDAADVAHLAFGPVGPALLLRVVLPDVLPATNGEED
jgi:hypothetical protein